MTKQDSFFSRTKEISPYQVAVFRILLGIFFIGQVAQLGSSQLTSSENGLLLAASFILAWGGLRRVAALVLWLGFVGLYLTQPLLEPAASGLVGLLLLFQVLLPAGEGLGFGRLKADPDWRFPGILFCGSWLLLGIYYGWNAILMCQSPSWTHGMALREILQSILAQEGWLRKILLGLGDGTLKGLSFILLGTQLLFPVLALLRKARPWVWLGMLLVQIFWFFLLNDGAGSLGLILFQLWIFDPAWFAARQPVEGKSLVLYDGVCGLCNGTVQFLLGEDREKGLLFTSLQGKTAEGVLEQKSRDDLSSVVYVRDWQTDQARRFTHSDAVLQILKDLGGFWRVVSWARFVPRVLRDLVYRGVAKVRYKVFGRYESCPLPSAEERERFLE